jgi:predicted negative regulator of RcsB-dependent stress response
MATTSHRKISRKELRQPDEFVTLVDRAGQFIADNLFRIIIGVVLAIAIVAAGFSISFYEQHQTRVAAEDFYQGMRSLEHKDYKKAERQFSDLIDSHGGSRLGRLAQFYLATAYMDDNQPAKARDVLEAFLKRSNRPLFEQMALMQLGVANEDLGDYRAAHEAYLRAAMIDGPRKQAAELGVARTLARQGQKAEAIAAYQQFLKENPFSQERDSVVEALANLGVAPAGGSIATRTIEMPPIGAAPSEVRPSANAPAKAPAPAPAAGHTTTKPAPP